MSSFEHQHSFYLETVFAKNLRNLCELSLTLSPTSNLFIGPNGHGKTNCLEVIALACSLRSMQPLPNIDLIKFHEPQAKIMANFAGAQFIKVEIDIFATGKKAKINEQTLKASSQLANLIPVVSFIPVELNLIAGAHSLRRRALDQAAAALFFEHLLALKSYDKLLGHRNRLLKDWPIDQETLATFTDMLIKEAAQIRFFRLKTIDCLSELFADFLKKVLGPGHHGSISYQAHDRTISNHTISDAMDFLNIERDAVRQLEYKRKVTMFGPHLDDVIFLINDINAKNFASRGQSRALVFAFKMAQITAIYRIRGLAPIIILDDIVSELDNLLKGNLLATIARVKGQAFFSTTDLNTFSHHMHEMSIFELNHGQVERRP